jgi:hypothetical protein
MTDFALALAALRRPKILIRAARAGVVDYRRERDLKRILRSATAGTERAFGTLLAVVDGVETNRTTGDATYNHQRHIGVLTALIAAARLLPLAGAA